MICKIWGVKAHIKSGLNTTNIKKGLSNLLNYIDDKEKIYGLDLENPFEIQQYEADDLEREIKYIQTSENFFRIIDYMADEHKTKNAFVSGYLCDPEHAIEQFMETKFENLDRLNKDITDDLGNQGFHIVQSFPDDLDISDEEVHQCGVELCEKIKVHQAVITSHLHPVYDKNGVLKGNCKHNHILINSHINPEFIDPKHPERMKYHDCKESYAQLRAWNDEIAIEHGLPIILSRSNEKPYSWYENELQNEGKSWMKRMMYDLEDAMNAATSWEEYKEILTSHGYQIQEGKHETYTAPDKIHKARGKRFGYEYTKAYMKQYWALKQELNALLESNLKDMKDYEKGHVQPLTGLQVAEFLNEKDNRYHIEIPRINKRDNSQYTFKIPLRFDFEQTIAKQYIKDDLSYPLYNKDRQYIGNVQGKVLNEVIFSLNMEQYLRFKHWEEEETKRTEQEEIKAILKNSQKEATYSVPGWNNSKTKAPYRVGLYDSETGRMRSLLEHVLIFAMVVINNEMPEFVLPEAQREKIRQEDERLSLIIKEPSKKERSLMEAIIIARDENIKTREDLKERLNDVGKNFSKVRSAHQRNKTAMEHMRLIYDAITFYEKSASLCEELFAMEGGEKKNQLLKENNAIILEYNYAKSILYQHNVMSPDQQKDFLERWHFHKSRDEKLSAEVSRCAEQYKKLKKLEYQIKLAMDKEYCYGYSKDLDKYISKDASEKDKHFEKEMGQKKEY